MKLEPDQVTTVYKSYLAGLPPAAQSVIAAPNDVSIEAQTAFIKEHRSVRGVHRCFRGGTYVGDRDFNLEVVMVVTHSDTLIGTNGMALDFDNGQSGTVRDDDSAA
jgi:hypothetical protein